MSTRSATAIASTAVAIAFAATVATSGLARTAGQGSERPRGAVESCATQSGAKFPGAFTSPRNLVVGPLALIGAGGTAGGVELHRDGGFPEVPAARQER